MVVGSLPKLRTDCVVLPDFEVLLCPVCGFYYVHPLKVAVATGEDKVTVDSKGVQVVRGGFSSESMEAHMQRGVRIIIEYQCENGHHGEIVLQFHKGSTFVMHNCLPSAEKWTTLWRT